ncbi:MAG: amidase [Alphaproteobacteria bacterium]|jgi:amidase|nr:amidase [Alphaproteobacteria bacterium]
MSHFNRRQALISGGALAAFLPLAGACAPARTQEAGASDTQVMDGVRLAELVSEGEMTAGEAVEAAISRAEAVEPRINAIATRTFDSARERAEAVPQGALAGVPTFIKDLADRKGEPTFYGSRAFKDYVAPDDDPIAAAWRRAGLISLGKSTSPEMGLTASTEPLVTGPTRNPWNTDYTPGGSSGGAAALTAARVVPFAHASDGGGSIRIPASCCGLFGLKPSRGRLHHGGGESPPVDISVSHAVSLTVRDSVAAFRINETGAYPAIGEVSGPASRRLKIAFAPEPPAGGPLDPQVRRGAEDTAALCRELGHEVIESAMSMDGEEFTDRFLLYWASGAAEFADAASRMTGQPVSDEIVEPWTLYLREMFLARRSEMPDTIAYLKAFEGRYAAMFEEFDVLLTPTLAAPPSPIGHLSPAIDGETHFRRVTEFAAYTAPMNVAGAASMSVPLAWTSGGLPIGMMFSGRRGDDAILFQLAYELEAARPWIEKVPPISA